MQGLMLHAGAAEATLEQVAVVVTPEARGEWVPIPHLTLLDSVKTALLESGMRVTSEAFGLWVDGSRFFAVLGVQNGENRPDYQTLVGLRNSHDMSIAAGLVLGSRVFVCDNNAFSGEVSFARKHTTNILRDLPILSTRAVERLHAIRGWQDERIEAYKAYELGEERTVNNFVVETLDAGILPATKIKPLLKEWRTPRHDAFKPRCAWSFFNAYTETMKGAFTQLPARTMTLHRMFDKLVGLTAPATVELPKANLADATDT